MKIRYQKLALWVALSAFISCKDMPSKTHGPIRLGDSSTIVTEADQARLQDMVTDLKPVLPAPAPDTAGATVAAIPKDTPKTVQAATPVAPPPPVVHTGNGLKAEFKEVTITLPGLVAKVSGSGNLQNANGAVYTWQSGNVNGNVMYTTSGVTKVSQRYQSVVILKGKNGNLPLESLSEQTNWAQVKGNNNAWPITGLAENQLEFSDASANEIKNAVIKSARARHLSHKKTQEWLSVLGNNVRAANQRPLVVTLRSAMWKIDGKDTQGKIFSKQLRVDIPF